MMKRSRLLTDEGRREVERTIKMLSKWYRKAKARGDRIEIWEGEINALFRLLQLDELISKEIYQGKYNSVSNSVAGPKSRRGREVGITSSVPTLRLSTREAGIQLAATGQTAIPSILENLKQLKMALSSLRFDFYSLSHTHTLFSPFFGQTFLNKVTKPAGSKPKHRMANIGGLSQKLNWKRDGLQSLQKPCGARQLNQRASKLPAVFDQTFSKSLEGGGA